MTPLSTAPTRVTPSSSSCLDNICVSIQDVHNCHFSVLNDFVSDHSGQMLLLHIDENISKAKVDLTQRRIFSNDNITYFRKLLSTQKWDTVLKEEDVNVSFNRLCNILSNAFSTASPLKTIKSNSIKNKQDLWVTDEIIRMKNRVALYANLSMKYPSFKPIFSLLNSQYQDMLVARRKAYNDNLIMTANNKSKATWRIINKITNKSFKDSNIEIFENGVTCSVKESAEKLNNFFASVAHNCTANLPNTIDIDFVRSSIPPNLHSFFLHQ